jgi:hypothetical protein
MNQYLSNDSVIIYLFSKNDLLNDKCIRKNKYKGQNNIARMKSVAQEMPIHHIRTQIF